MVKFASNCCYCAVDQEKAVFQWKWAVSGPSALLGPEMVKFAPNFCYCAVDQEKAVFQWKRVVSSNGQIYFEFLLLCCFFNGNGRFWPICPFGARNGQICFEFLLLCCRPRKGRFSMETGRFWPICPFGARNGTEFLLLVKFASNFCYCAVDQEKAVFQWKRPFLASALVGPEMVKFAPNFWVL